MASCAPRCNGATVMDRARLFPAADRLPVVPSELRSKGTRREALGGLASGTFLFALSGERRALWSVRCPDYLQAIPHHRFTARRSCKTWPLRLRRPAAELRQRLGRHARPWNGTNGGAILYVTYSRCTGTFSSALRLVSRIRSPVRFSVSETCLSSQPSVSGRCLTAWAAESSVLPDVAAMNLNIISRARVHVRLAG